MKMISNKQSEKNSQQLRVEDDDHYSSAMRVYHLIKSCPKVAILKCVVIIQSK